jgi:hypothetical protein
MSGDAICLDIAFDGSVFAREMCLSKPSRDPIRSAADQLSRLGIPGDAVVTFRKLGAMVRTATLQALRSANA